MKSRKQRFSSRLSGILKQTCPAVLLFAGTAIAPSSASASTFEIFLISEHSAPVGTGSALSVTTQTVYQLGGLNGNNKATSASIVDNFTFDVGQSLTFSSSANPDPSKPTDPGEVGAGTAPYVNAEIASWDNSGIPGTTPAAEDQIDFGRNASVTFNSVAGGFTDLILSDLGGLNPFDLSLCSDATCDPTNSTFTQLFAGFSRGLAKNLIGSLDFAASDDPADGGQDQTWLFRFDAPVTDYVQVLEFDNRNVFTGARLQADFIGTNSEVAPSPVPLPAGLPLLASGFVLLGWGMRRRKG